MSPGSDWTVLFLGGPMAVGKTNAAKRIAVVTGASVLQVDDMWLALQRGIDPTDGPLLHTFASAEVWTRPATELVALARELAELVSSSLELVVAHHLEREDRVVIEGMWLTPEFATRVAYAGTAAKDRRRAVFVLDEQSAPQTSAAAHGRTLGMADPVAIAALRAGYTRWLRTQALMRGAPIVDARPTSRLAERILTVL